MFGGGVKSLPKPYNWITSLVSNCAQLYGKISRKPTHMFFGSSDDSTTKKAIRKWFKDTQFLEVPSFSTVQWFKLWPLVGGFHVYFRKGIWLSQMCVS